MSRWDRSLWGVLFISGNDDKEGILLGSLWNTELGGNLYDGEPTRALLFCTRQKAREWCKERMRKWRDGRQPNDIVMLWVVRPVRVRETVQID